MVERNSRRRAGRIAALLLIALAVVLWSGWAERYPTQERRLRIEVQEQLQARFPGEMQPSGKGYGIFPRNVVAVPGLQPDVLLVHGLDEPGGIWGDLVPVLAAAGFSTREFRYPNDQAIDSSADLLAAAWLAIPEDRRLVLIGHSMGGLVIRDFVSRWRHPVASPPGVAGATVEGVILVGTPNRGSDLARFRVWLELRDHLAPGVDSEFSVLGGLRDGTGAAKIDLLPGSEFLDRMNARPWPASVPMRIIGGILPPLIPLPGDGAVAVESLQVAGAPPPILVTASHRGMLKRLLPSDPEPPAIPHIMAMLEALSDLESRSSP